MIRLLPLFLFTVLFAGLQGYAAPSDSVSPPAPALADSADTSAVKPDSTDSLRAGKREDTGLKVEGRKGIGPVFHFLIPVSRSLSDLRSSSENEPENTYMEQSVDRFDENDIAFPLGIGFRYRLNDLCEPRAEAVYFHLANANGWSPKNGKNDTLPQFRTSHTNAYAIDAVKITAGVQFNISRDFLVVDNFERLYLGLEANGYPLLHLATERTLLNRKVDAFGIGWGGAMVLGIERALSAKSSLAGELGYGIESWGPFSENGSEIRESDVLRSGGQNAYAIAMRSLFFRFSVYRWY